MIALIALFLLAPPSPPMDGDLDTLPMYYIYDSPLNRPGVFVVREWRVSPGRVVPGPILGTAKTLEDARKLVPPRGQASAPAGTAR